VGLIYHVAFAADWNHACQVGEYRVSTRGHTLEEVGFIHCSQGNQVEPVANAVYQGAEDLVLLSIDPDRVRSEIRYEKVHGWEDPFPHIHGPLNADAVVEVNPFRPGPKGRFAFPRTGAP
jgi:glutathione S-transferase